MQTVWQDRLEKNSSTHQCPHEEKMGKIQERGRTETVAAETVRRQPRQGKRQQSKNVRTPDNNEAAHVAADEDPRENCVRNKIATRERSDPNSEQQCRVGHGNCE